MKHYGDITKLNGAQLEPVDLIVGGSPCQDLSVAGRREGLAGERSGLFMEMIRIVKEMRDATNFIRPRYLLWENVPGAFSSNKGADFQAVLTEIVRIVEPEAPDVPMPAKGWSKSGVLMGDGWSVAYRTHDAQYWGKTIRDSRTGDVLAMGTPQRRRRIALVADFRGQSAPEILFERKSMSGNSEQSGEAREDITGTVGKSTEDSGEPDPIVMNPRPMSMVTQLDKAATLGADDYKEPQVVLSFQERAGRPGGGQRDPHSGRPCRSVEYDEQTGGMLQHRLK